MRRNDQCRLNRLLLVNTLFNRPALLWRFILLSDFLPAFATPCGCDLDAVFAVRVARYFDEHAVAARQSLPRA